MVAIDLTAFEPLDHQAILNAANTLPFEFHHERTMAATNATTVAHWLAAASVPQSPAAGHGRQTAVFAGFDATQAEPGQGDGLRLTLAAHVSYMPQLLAAELALADAWAPLPGLPQAAQFFGANPKGHPDRVPVGLRVDLPNGLASEELVGALHELWSFPLQRALPGFRLDSSSKGASSSFSRRGSVVSVGIGDVDDDEGGLFGAPPDPFKGRTGVAMRGTEYRAAHAEPAHAPALWVLGMARVDAALLGAVPADFVPPDDLHDLVAPLATTARELDRVLSPGARAARWLALDTATRERVGKALGPAERSLLEQDARVPPGATAPTPKGRRHRAV